MTARLSADLSLVLAHSPRAREVLERFAGGPERTVLGAAHRFALADEDIYEHFTRSFALAVRHVDEACVTALRAHFLVPRDDALFSLSTSGGYALCASILAALACATHPHLELGLLQMSVDLADEILAELDASHVQVLATLCEDEAASEDRDQPAADPRPLARLSRSLLVVS